MKLILYLLYDTAGIDPAISENNPNFFFFREKENRLFDFYFIISKCNLQSFSTSKLKSAKQFSKNSINLAPYKYVYSTLPECCQCQ